MESKVTFSDEAKWLIENIKDFDKMDCVEWYLKTQLVIGSHGILEYLKEKTKSKIVKPKFEIPKQEE